jgi:hypothetical protein
VKRDGWKPILALMVLAPLLAEVFSGSMPVTMFLQPGMFLAFTIFVYGLPILVLREVAVRRGYGLLGLYALGMIYGLFNEGLISETLYHPLDPHDPTYADYGLLAGLRIPLMSYLLPWHGLFSMITPVLVVDLLFPRKAGRPWLPIWALWVLGVVTGGLGLARFLLWGDDRAQDGGTFVIHLAVVLGMAALVWAGARRLPRTPVPATQYGFAWRDVAAGMGVYAGVLLGVQILAGVVTAPWPLTVLYGALAVATAMWAVGRRQAVARSRAVAFVLGAGLAQAAVTVLVVGALTGDTVRAVTGAVITMAYLAALVGIRASHRRGVREPAAG